MSQTNDDQERPLKLEESAAPQNPAPKPRQSETTPAPDKSPGRGHFTFPRPGATAAPHDYSIGFPDRFPIESFPTSIREIAEQLSAVYQTPVCLPAMGILAVMAAAVGKSTIALGAYKDKPTRLNLYVIAAAERGSGKGNIGETLIGPLWERSAQLADAHREEIASRRGEMGILKSAIAKLEKQSRPEDAEGRAQTSESLKEKYRELDRIEAETKRDVTLIISDSSSEALAKALAENNETLFAYSSEAGSALKIALGKYTDGNGDIDLLLSAYSGDFISSVRISRARVELKQPCLTLLWMVQPCLLRTLCSNEEAFSRGLTARPLIFDSEAQREIDRRDANSFTLGEQWKTLIDSIVDIRLALKDAGEPRTITATEAARVVFTDFHNESVHLGRNQFPDLAGELTRWRENAIKVAGLLALAEGSDTLTKDHAQAGCRIVRWAAYNYLAILQAGRRQRQEDDLERILKIVIEAGGEINVGDLAKTHGIKRDTLDAVIAACPGKLEIIKRPQPAGKPGQPAQILRRFTGESGKSRESRPSTHSVDSVDSPPPTPRNSTPPDA